MECCCPFRYGRDTKVKTATVPKEIEGTKCSDLKNKKQQTVEVVERLIRNSVASGQLQSHLDKAEAIFRLDLHRV